MGEEEEEEERSELRIREAIEVMSSLVSLSHSIKIFSVKWQMIRTKLDQLSSGLVVIENCGSDCSLTLSNLVQAILETVNDCHDLARRCLDVSFSGKLLMQSDLDMILGKFDGLAKNLSEVHSARVLSQGFAIVVPKPGANACRDDMRFYIRDVLTRMKIGDAEMKIQGLINLKEALEEEGDDRYLKITMEISDLVNLLVDFLYSTFIRIQEEALKILCLICGFDSYKPVLIQSGIIGPLVRILECSSSDLGKDFSARCLKKLTENSENSWSVSACGGVPVLLNICSNGELNAELIGNACGVLKHLLGVEEIKRFMIEEGVLSILIKLVSSKDEIVQVNSIDFLLTIATDDDQTRQIVLKEGAIRELVRISDPNLSSSSKTKETALRAIERLCLSSPSCVDMLLSYGFVNLLLNLLRNNDTSVQESALKATFKLCGVSDEAKRAMGDSGFMPALIRFLDSKSLAVREMASEALYRMVLLPKNRKRLAQDDSNIKNILKSLIQEEGATKGNYFTSLSSNKFLISILMSLARSNSARRKIVASGYLKNLERLADSEVSGAKKLVKRLSKTRFRSILNGIFHS